MLVGTEWIVDAEGCRPDALRDVSLLRALLERAIEELDLHVVGAPSFHAFPDPGGVTALFLLTESHLACHTYPEHAAATFNLYCCKPRAAWAWEERIREALGAARVRVRVVERTA
jgi:S-adenosylmethionine decarboxylase